MRERDSEGRVVACRWGHPYTPENIAGYNSGSRICKICSDARKPAPVKRHRVPLLIDFWSRLNVRGEIVRGLSSPCWIWKEPNSSGYGSFMGELAHRWSFQNFVGPIPEDLWALDHLCEQKACVNPDHLDPTSNVENSHRYWANRKAESK